MVSIFSKDSDSLVSGNNDGIITIWELVVNEESQAKPCLIGIINNADNPYEDVNTVCYMSVIPNNRDLKYWPCSMIRLITGY